MKRTPEEVVKDAEKIMNVLERACSLHEIESQTGLNLNQIKYSLKKVGKEAELKRVKEICSECGRICESNNYNEKERKENSYHGLETLFNTKVKNGELVFEINNDYYRYTQLVIKENNFIYSSGEHKLCIGDEIFSARRYKGKIIFMHYEVISLQHSKNVEVKYLKKIRENASVETYERKNDFSHKVFARDAALFFQGLEECLEYI